MGNGSCWGLDVTIKHNLQIIKLKTIYNKSETEVSISDEGT